MFGLDPSLAAGLGLAALLGAAGVLVALRRWQARRDRPIDWDVGGDIV